MKIKQSTKVNVVKYEMTVVRYRTARPGSEAEAGDRQRADDIQDDGKNAGLHEALSTSNAIPGSKQEE